MNKCTVPLQSYTTLHAVVIRRTILMSILASRMVLTFTTDAAGNELILFYPYTTVTTATFLVTATAALPYFFTVIAGLP